MTGLALRILTPGTKVDKVCILAGAQGIGKSTFFEKLSEFGGEQFYFACTSIASSAGDANRTQGMMMSRSTVVDLAEGVVFETKKQTLDTVKQVLTQTHDEYRIPYSKSPTIEPRGYIFVGTTNRYDQLSDTTGSRRYCYLHATKIEYLPYDEKLQILAEVAAQEENIRHSNWWIENVDLQTAPDKYRSEEFEHVTSIQELINTQFTKDDAAINFIRNILDSDEILHLADTGEGYITASFLSARAGRDQSDFMNTNFLSRKLSSLLDSPAFPYKLIQQRKRLPQLIGSEQLKLAYMSGITNTQMMVNGYIVRKK
jgi:predicted P-loop ATPase